MNLQLKARFLNFVYKALEHSYCTINHITKHACRNPISISGRNWCSIICKNGYVGKSMKEIYNKWYETLCDEEMGHTIMTDIRAYCNV